jgi:hypothetical protein
MSHLAIEVVPFIDSPNIVGEQKSPVEKIVSKPFDFRWSQSHVPDFHPVQEGEATEPRIIESNRVLTRIGIDRKHSFDDNHELAVGFFVIRCPGVSTV